MSDVVNMCRDWYNHGVCLVLKLNFYKNNDTFEIEFTRHVSVVQRPSSVVNSISNVSLFL